MQLSYTIPNAEVNILSGLKKHTIRADKKDRWKAGRIIHHAVNPYSKLRRVFHVDKCISIQKICISYTGRQELSGLVIHVNGKRLKADKIKALIINDGVQSISYFINWFFPVDKKSGKRLPIQWKGKIIHWTNLKY